MSQLRFIRQNIYQLKRRYPGTIDIIRRITNTVNVSTGIKTVSLSGVRVERAIVLPSAMSRAALFDRTYIANDRDFAYGTNFDVTTRTFIVDRQELPIDFEPQMGDYIVFREVRYNLQKIQSLEGFAFICLGKETLSEPPALSLALNVYDDLGSVLDSASFDTNLSPNEQHVSDMLLIDDETNMVDEENAADALMILESIVLEVD